MMNWSSTYREKHILDHRDVIGLFTESSRLYLTVTYSSCVLVELGIHNLVILNISTEING